MTRYKCAFMAMLFGGALFSSTAVQAQTWSTIGSACEPGSDSVGSYSYNGATFQFATGATGEVKTRCSVTNPLDSGVPKWTTLTVGYVDPDGTGTDYQVDAQLIRVNRTTGALGTIKTFDSSSFSSTGPTSHNITFSHTFDFTNYAYFVTLTVDRGDTSQNPGVWYAQLK